MGGVLKVSQIGLHGLSCVWACVRVRMEAAGVYVETVVFVYVGGANICSMTQDTRIDAPADLTRRVSLWL